MTPPERAPTVSVLLCVHNGAAHLAAAVASLLHQDLADWELIVVDDASTDSTTDLLRSFTDSRIRLLHNPVNLGLTRSLNIALRAARGEYIARLDADDTCHPERLARQAAFLDAHPAVGLLGTAARGPDGDPRTGPMEETEIRWWLLFDNVFVHSSVMFRAGLVRERGYDETMTCAQDYALWSSWAGKTHLAKLPEPLVTISDHPGQISHRRAEEQKRCAVKTSLANLSALLGEPVDEAGRAELLSVYPRPPNRPSLQLLSACQRCLRLFNAFLSAPGVDGRAARGMRRAWMLRVLNSLAWNQRGEARSSGLLGDFFRAEPMTVFWYAGMRVWWKLRRKTLTPPDQPCQA